MEQQRGPIRIGVLADPEAASEEVANRLSTTFATELAEVSGGDPSDWEIRVETERLPSGARDDSVSILDRAADWRREHGLTAVVCVSDLPMYAEGAPIVADLTYDRGVAVLSVPAFGGMSLGRRVRRMAAVLVAELLWPRGIGDLTGEQRPRSDRRRVAADRRFRWRQPDEDGVDIRVLASRGWFRLLVGMVRDNRPWRLATGLTGALVAAFAISAFYLVSSVAWQIGSMLGPVRLTIAMLAAWLLLVLWLILRHGMWERPRHADIPYERQQIRMFNLSTVLTLAIGVLLLYVMLFAAILAAAALLIPGDLLSQYTGGSGPGAYLVVCWMITSVATLGGALGSGLDSDRAVRAAAYGYRERERLERWQRSDRSQRGESGGDGRRRD